MQRILLVYAFVLMGGALLGLGCSRATEESAGETLESARTTVELAGSDLRDHANAAGARAEVATDDLGEDLGEGLDDTAEDVERGIDEAGADLAGATAEGAERVEREARETEREARERRAE